VLRRHQCDAGADQHAEPPVRDLAKHLELLSIVLKMI
jgi:hypothetical protein